MLRLGVLLALAGSAACYAPEWGDVACGPGGSCPSGRECNSENMCVPPGEATDSGSGSTVDADDVTGGRVDASLADAPDECLGWDLVTQIDACEIASDRRGGVIDLDSGNYTYDTATGVFSLEGGPPIAHNSDVLQEIRYLSAENITVQSGATLRVVGDRPLLIVAWNDLTVAGEIDAASRAGADGSGAGADPTECLTGSIAAGPGGRRMPAAAPSPSSRA